MRFELHECAPGCAAGVADAMGVMDPARSYSLRELMATGLKPENVLWYVLQKIDEDPVERRLILKGLGNAALQVGMSGVILTWANDEEKWDRIGRIGKAWIQKNCRVPLPEDAFRRAFQFVVDHVADMLEPLGKEPTE